LWLHDARIDAWWDGRHQMKSERVRLLLSAGAQGFALRCFSRPVPTLFAWVVAAAFGTLGVAQLEVDTTTESVLVRSGAAWERYEQSRRLFGGDDVIVIAIEGERPLDPRAIQLLIELTSELQKAPGVRRVDSLASVPLVRTDADGSIRFEAAFRSDRLLDADSLKDLARDLRKDRVSARLLISDDQRTMGINVVLGESPTGTSYRDILDEIETLLGGQQAWVSGVPVFRAEANRRSLQELRILVPATIAVLATVLAMCFGSLWAVFVALVTAGLGTWILAGVMGALGVPFTLATFILPSVVLAIGCSYAMHLLAAVAGRPSGTAIEDAIRSVVTPIAISGLTTISGFMAISLVNIEAIRFVGLMGAIGVSGTLLAALSVVPALVSLRGLPRSCRARVSWIRMGIAGRCARLVTAGPLAMVGIWLAVATPVIGGVVWLQVETDVTQWFEPGNAVRDSYEEIRSRLSGISPMNVVIVGREGQSLATPETLSAIDEFVRFAEATPQVGRVLSIVDLIAQLHDGFEESSEGTIPESQELIEQYLLILESMEQAEDLITPQREAVNIALRLDNNGSAYLLRTAELMDDWWAARPISGVSVSTTGVMFEFARAAQEISWGQLKGLGAAIIAIGLLIVIFLGSLQLAVLAVLPNTIPIAMAFGLMGWTGVALDAGTVLIGSVALGIAVDDSVHLLNAYQEERQKYEATEDVIAAALARVFPPLLFTTAAISLGFLILGASGFAFIRNMGLITAGVFALCFAAAVILLPAFLYMARTQKKPDAE
jgi:uncharacterized protein